MHSKSIFFMLISLLSYTLTIAAAENDKPERKSLLRAVSATMKRSKSGNIKVVTRTYSEEETNDLLKERRANLLNTGADGKSKTPSPLSITPVEKDVTQWEIGSGKGMKRAKSDSFGQRPLFPDKEMNEDGNARTISSNSELGESASLQSGNSEEKTITCCEHIKLTANRILYFLKIKKKVS